MHPRDSNFVCYFENISWQTLCQRMPGGGGGNGMSQYMTPDICTLFAYQMKTNNHYKNSPFHPRCKLGHLLHDQKVIHIHSYEIKQQWPFIFHTFIFSFLRSISYREFSRLVYGFLGNKRIPLPACAYTAIRKAFPCDKDDGFTGFDLDEEDVWLYWDLSWYKNMSAKLVRLTSDTCILILLKSWLLSWDISKGWFSLEHNHKHKH